MRDKDCRNRINKKIDSKPINILKRAIDCIFHTQNFIVECTIKHNTKQTINFMLPQIRF